MSARYVALSGGVGGAKLCLGLSHVLGDRLSIVVNTGDDFEHLGLFVSPDVDTTLYTLSGLVNPETGWGRRDETWTFMRALEGLGGPQWFNLGDGDLALHVERTRRLKAGETLTAITGDVARALGVKPRVLPMSDAPIATIVETDEGVLGFQHYFVRRRCEPVVKRLRFDGAERGTITPEIRAALNDPELRGIIVCPSNPWLSIDPLLAVPGLREALAAAPVPKIAVTPIIDGKAVKGPTAKIMGELGITPDAVAVADHYAGLIDGFVLDEQDASLSARIGTTVALAQTLMRTLDDKIALAQRCIGFCEKLAGRA
ncbi:MAG: 2-phospho-L-lactate transferase [Hyphomicrobiales bacterium]|nr:MAG: 2-phospho-L-lactate transferase [Hyphomicrobiales bacterium]